MMRIFRVSEATLAKLVYLLLIAMGLIALLVCAYLSPLLEIEIFHP